MTFPSVVVPTVALFALVAVFALPPEPELAIA
jgi:hypothetical protein